MGVGVPERGQCKIDLEEEWDEVVNVGTVERTSANAKNGFEEGDEFAEMLDAEAEMVSVRTRFGRDLIGVELVAELLVGRGFLFCVDDEIGEMSRRGGGIEVVGFEEGWETGATSVDKIFSDPVFVQEIVGVLEGGHFEHAIGSVSVAFERNADYLAVAAFASI